MVKSALEAICQLFVEGPSALPYFVLVLIIGLYCISELAFESNGESDELQGQDNLKWALKVSVTVLMALLGNVCLCLNYRMQSKTIDKIRPLTIRETVYQPSMTIKGWIKLECITTGKIVKEKLVEIIKSSHLLDDDKTDIKP